MRPTGEQAPALSVILITVDHYQTIRRTVAYLRAQTARDRLELVLLAPSRQQLAADAAELREFRHLQIIELGRVTSTAHARAVGIRAALAPVIAFVEEHSFPAP